MLAGAVIGVMMSVFLPEHMAAEAGAEIVSDAMFGPDSASRLDEALALLEEGCRSKPGPTALLYRARNI